MTPFLMTISGPTSRGHSRSGMETVSSSTAPRVTRLAGASPGLGNVISGNRLDGLFVSGAGATGSQIVGNRIGVDFTGSKGFGNAEIGVEINGAPGNTVGGTTAGSANVISANLLNGVEITGAAATRNVVEGNFIGTDSTGNATVGVFICCRRQPDRYRPFRKDGRAEPRRPDRRRSPRQRDRRYYCRVARRDLRQRRRSLYFRRRCARGASGNQVLERFIGLDAGGKVGPGNRQYGALLYNAPSNRSLSQARRRTGSTGI
jgi:hypothetical protein